LQSYAYTRSRFANQPAIAMRATAPAGDRPAQAIKFWEGVKNAACLGALFKPCFWPHFWPPAPVPYGHHTGAPPETPETGPKIRPQTGPQKRAKKWMPSRPQHAPRLKQNLCTSPITKCGKYGFHPTQLPQIRLSSQALTLNYMHSKTEKQPSASINPRCALPVTMPQRSGRSASQPTSLQPISFPAPLNLAKTAPIIEASRPSTTEGHQAVPLLRGLARVQIQAPRFAIFIAFQQQLRQHLLVSR
jgi:hypothetical protein